MNLICAPPFGVMDNDLVLKSVQLRRETRLTVFLSPNITLQIILEKYRILVCLADQQVISREFDSN